MASQTREQERSQNHPPSPSPSPPTLSAPGPRATALQNLYTSAIAHILKTCSYPNFSACFPTPCDKVPNSMKLLHEQFTAKLSENFHREFNNILEDRNVVASLNELDRLVEEAKRRKDNAAVATAAGTGKEGDVGTSPTPPHTLPPTALYLSHLAPTLSHHATAISAQQTSIETENVELLARVMQQRKEIASLVQGLENVVDDLDASVATLNQQPAEMEALKEECRNVDEGLRMEM